MTDSTLVIASLDETLKILRRAGRRLLPYVKTELKRLLGVELVDETSDRLLMKFHGLGIYLRLLHNFAVPTPSAFAEYGRWLESDEDYKYVPIGRWAVDLVGRWDGKLQSSEMARKFAEAAVEVIAAAQTANLTFPFEGEDQEAK